MLKKFGASVIISLLMLLVYNSDMFTIEKKIQIMEVFDNGTVRAVHIPMSGKPQNYIIHSKKKFGEWEVSRELSAMGNTVMFTLLMIIVVLVVTAMLKPEPFNPYRK